MERKMYKMTEKQVATFAGKQTQEQIDVRVAEIRSGVCDDSLKGEWARTHHGKVTGWGMGKSQLIINLLQGTIEYQRGIWQGRVDAARGLGYAEDRLEKSYNLGYHRGYVNYKSDRRGWDAQTRAQFDAEYLNE